MAEINVDGVMIPRHLVEQWVEAAHLEFVDGKEGEIGRLYDRESFSGPMMEKLGPLEEHVRSSGNSEQALYELEVRWGVANGLPPGVIPQGKAELVMAQVVPVQQQMEGSASGARVQELSSLIGNSQKLLVEQSFSLLEALTGGACERNNQYRITNEAGEDILHAQEDSNGCARCCCAPHHSTKVYITNAQTNETLLTIERLGLDFPCPHKCLGNRCICCDCCADGITVYEGHVFGDAGDLTAAPEPMVMVKQPICGGGLTPTLNVYPKGQVEAPFSHQITGPTLFGGCSECCCKSTFEFKGANGQHAGNIVHLVPTTCDEVCDAFCTDVDKFELQFQQTATPMDKATALASAILVDFMFFEMDNGMIACKNGKLEITCCFMYCCGSLVPCKIPLAKKGEGGGG
eukprot:TRINITY_DN5364_c0_g1_i1.p1 TRINITY_DN5364_c0_g1~~TRINITY_DN5364_c0_g1_i1.p1  ORF type:complete len:404 (-),score=60.71 TRINITY_DN5364_c0_g1_i1:223-1434(-)